MTAYTDAIDAIITSNGVNGITAANMRSALYEAETHLGGGGGMTLYESTPVELVAGTLYEYTHGLGAIPKIVTLHLVSTTTLFGYSIGDEQIIHLGDYSNLRWLHADATKVYLQGTSTFRLVNKTSGGTLVSSSSSNFDIFVRAWA